MFGCRRHQEQPVLVLQAVLPLLRVQVSRSLRQQMIPSIMLCDLGNGYCYYNNPTPSSGNFRVVKGGTNTITYPWADNGIDTVWNGNFAFCQSGKYGAAL